MVELKNKWALVTGASRGVGMRVARALGQKGCRMIIHARTLKGSDVLASEFRALGVEVHQLQAELSDPDQVDSLIRNVKKICGGTLDILYNNAGLNFASRDIYTIPADEYSQCFQVNCIAPAKLCDAFLPAMLEQNWGRIVNVSSGIADQPNLMAYSCSKAALDRYVRDMIPTLKGSNVLMNLLDPGWLRTDMGGSQAPNDPDTVLPGALVPVLLEQRAGSGTFYAAQDYSDSSVQ